MDKESIVKLITKEVYEYIKQQNISVTEGNESQIIFADMRPGLKITDIERILHAAADQKGTAVCIPQWFVPFAKEISAGRNIRVATVTGLPGGASSARAKYAEVKQAVTGGADMVLIPINMGLFLRGDITGVKNDLSESMAAAKMKAEAIAVIEIKDLDKTGVQKAAEACISCGADSVMLSCATGGRLKPDMVRGLKEAGIYAGVYGGVSDMAAQDQFKQAGARWITVLCR